MMGTKKRPFYEELVETPKHVNVEGPVNAP